MRERIDKMIPERNGCWQAEELLTKTPARSSFSVLQEGNLLAVMSMYYGFVKNKAGRRARLAW